jgi:hypothetical protein
MFPRWSVGTIHMPLLFANVFFPHGRTPCAPTSPGWYVPTLERGNDPHAAFVCKHFLPARAHAVRPYITGVVCCVVRVFSGRAVLGGDDHISCSLSSLIFRDAHSYS